jgi:hypothetical protein
MPGYVSLAVAVLAASAQPPTPTTISQAAGSAEIRARHEVCYALAAGASDPALDLAGCLSFDKAPEAVFWTQVCSFLRESDQLQDYNLASYSDCIRQRGSW